LRLTPPPTPDIYTLSLHDALPISMLPALRSKRIDGFATSLPWTTQPVVTGDAIMLLSTPRGDLPEYIPFDYVVLYTRPEVCQKEDRKSTRLNSSHVKISYAVFCLK